MMRQDTKEAHFLLNSWKEIAQYLGRGVRTVQRWERELQLPVHRIGNGSRSPVYANATELRFWMNTSEAVRRHFQKGANVTVIQPKNPRPIEDSRRLMLEARNLARKIAETSVRQRRQAEDLQARVLEMRSRVR